MEKATDSLLKASDGVEDYPTDEIQELLVPLPREKNKDGSYLYQYQGFWYSSADVAVIVSIQRNFQAQNGDIILITYPKSGTTWLKALIYAIVHRSHHAFDSNPLLTTNPHELVPFIEYPGTRCSTGSIFGTHFPYSSMPHSIMNSNCRIVYMCRNPLDQCVSYWQFMKRIDEERKVEPLSLEETVEKVCQGTQIFGPFWEHVLGYWKASLDNPHKILFLKYEDVMEDPVSNVKKLADFLGCPFSNLEDNRGVIQEVIKLCSFDNMKDLEANKSGRLLSNTKVKSSNYFREGKVGDWANYLTPSMSERLKKLTEEKFFGSGLTFKMS